MNLPEFLSEAPYGEILLAGHRIGLYHVIASYREGYSVERLHEQYPTLSVDLIQKVVDFYHANQADVEAYMKACQKDIDGQRAAAPRVIDWEELKRRFAALAGEGK
jgi:uncharacterized protein (DUF433 family)